MKREFWFLGNWYVSKEENGWCVFMKPIKDWVMHPVKTWGKFQRHKPKIIDVYIK
jgi:hypothetical protein